VIYAAKKIKYSTLKKTDC